VSFLTRKSETIGKSAPRKALTKLQLYILIFRRSPILRAAVATERQELGATQLSYSTVRNYVRFCRAEIDLAAGRADNERWVLFGSHYGFDAFYCQPGIACAHEKGGVEGEAGRFRRTRLSPMPVVDSPDELNERIRCPARATAGRLAAHPQTDAATPL
jgi:hypothetical protein